MPVDVTINGIDYKNVKELNEHGVSWRPSEDVIDKPTGTYYIIRNGEYDVSKYAKVSVSVGNMGYSDLSVAIPQTFKVGSTIEDIRNSITAAKVNITQMGLSQPFIITDYSTIGIELSSGSTVVAGAQTIMFVYYGATMTSAIAGSEGKAKITTSGTGFTVDNLDSENKLWITSNNLSIKIEADDGYRFFSGTVTVGVKQNSSYEDITNTRCAITVDDPQHVSVVVSDVNNSDEFLVTAAPVALSDCATFVFLCGNSKIKAGGSYTRNYQTVVAATANPLFYIEADEGYAFLDVAPTVTTSDGSAATLQSTVQNKTGLSLYFTSLKGGVTYNVSVNAYPAINLSLTGTNTDTYSIDGLNGVAGKLPIGPTLNIVTLKVSPKSGYTLGTVTMMKNGLGYANFSESVSDNVRTIIIRGLSQYDSILLYVQTTKS